LIDLAATYSPAT